MSEAEDRTRERARAAELRVAGLEQRVSELSELLGSCEKARQRDQQAAQRLRDRILQLDTENKTLALTASSRSGPDLGPESQLSVAALKERLQSVKKLLLLAAQSDPDQTLQDLDLEPHPEPDRAPALQQELQQLREEFERYKVRAQVVLKNKSLKEGCQQELQELREKYIDLRVQSDQAAAQHRHQLEQCQQHAAALQHAHRQELERLEAQHRDRLLRLEAELHKQRERTVKLLDDKDQELERLRSSASSRHTADRPDGEQEAGSDDEGDAVGQALRRAAPTESTLLLYAEQLARKEVEAGSLRRHKLRLEEELHQLRAQLIADAEHHEEETTQLRDRLHKLTRDQSREGANLEYLKNVVYRFLTLQDVSGRRQTLGAIVTILHFSPQEKQEVMKLQGSSWWGPTFR